MRQDLRIIVEGMDGSGKSTLVRRLTDDFDGLVLVKNPLDDKQDFNKWWPQELDRTKSYEVPIHDRFFWSELVYGPVIRGRLAVGEILLNNVVLFLRQVALLVYARPHSSIIMEAMKVNDQMPGVFEKKRELLGLYDNLMMVEKQWFKNRFVRYDWNTPESYENVRVRVKAYLKGELYD